MLKTIIFIALLLSQTLPIVSNTNLYQTFTQSHQIDPNSTVTIAIVEKPNNLPLLQFYVENHIVLNSTEVYRLFIPNDSITNALNYLSKFDLDIEVYLNVIVVSGKASVVESALGGTIYYTKFNGITFYQFIGNPPASLGNALVIGTNITASLLSKPNTIYNVTQAIAYNYFTPQDLQEAYNVTWLYKHGISGNGTVIGILDFSGDPYIVEQLHSFDSMFNLPDPPFFEIQPIGAYNPNEGISNGWALEISLDVEYAHAIAPNAGIILYVANLNTPLPAAIAFIDQQDKVNVVSQSFGIPEIYVNLGLIPLSFVQSLTYEYWLGEVEGITFVAASGDGGGNGNNFYLFPEGNQMLPASDPYVLAVGGSTLYVSGNSFLQTAWSGESIYGATTGGPSSIFPSPWYQDIKGFRSVPDVIADGNPYSGVQVIYYYGQIYLVGGTSLATPIVASIIDLASQVHGKLGFINPLIYSLNGTRALVPISFGYNTPYIVNSTPNFVSGLGYINAGYFVNLIHNTSSISIAVTNSTYLDGEIVEVIVKAPKSVAVEGYVYNGNNVIQRFPLAYNGTYWIGQFIATGSGIEEIVVKQGNQFVGTYITVGYQALFILPEVAIYPEPGNMDILVELMYPNGSAAVAPSSLQAYVYKYNPTNNSFLPYTNVTLSRPSILVLPLFGIILINNGSYLFGTFNDSRDFGGIYIIKVEGVFGFDEYVEGAYVIPFVVPPVFTEPTVVSPGSNLTIGVAIASLGYPNVTLELVNSKGSLTYYTNIDAININNEIFYVKEIALPNNVTPGYYYVIAKAEYDSGSSRFVSYGVTQIYVSPYNLNVKIVEYPASGIYQNQSFLLKVLITYPNGSIVKFGTFNAVIVPSYLLGAFESLTTEFSTPLKYEDGYWIANVTTPSGISNPLGSSSSGISGEWYIYIYGASASGIPTPLAVSLDYNSLAIVPKPSKAVFTLLPYVFVKYFNGTIAYNMFIQNAIIINHNATFVNSIIYNLTAINSTITLINSQVYHENLINSELIGSSNVTHVTVISDSNNISSYSGEKSVESAGLLLGILVVLLGIFILIVIKVK